MRKNPAHINHLNRWKKKIAILLTVAMTAGVMAACGSSNETPAQPAAESTPQAAATTGEENQENCGSDGLYELDFLFSAKYGICY